MDPIYRERYSEQYGDSQTIFKGLKFPLEMIAEIEKIALNEGSMPRDLVLEGIMRVIDARNQLDDIVIENHIEQ